MRYHEFYKFEDNMVTEIQAIWDIPELMIQANVRVRRYGKKNVGYGMAAE